MRLSSLFPCVLVALVGFVGCSSEDAASPAEACQGEACAKAPCGPDERTEDGTGACIPLGWHDCPAGFVLDASGFGCNEVLPAAPAACPARAMPVIGHASCMPVAAKPCAAGFAQAPSGWGCRAVLPAAPCAGATMEALGQSACVAVGDCSAAFPPAGATHFVDAAYAAGDLDATHFKTIGDALAAAPANAVIAVQSGSYVESLAPARAVRIAGRCAAQVTVASAAGTTPGIHPGAGIEVTLEGVTLTGHLRGALVDGGAKLTLRNVVLDANRAGGAVAAAPSSRLVVDHSVIRKTVEGGGGLGYGIEASASADVVVQSSAISENTATGIQIIGKGSHLHIEQSAILRTRTDATNQYGNGVVVRSGSIAEVIASAIAQNHEHALVSFGAGTSVTATDTTIEDTKNSAVGYGRGLLVDTGTATLERVTISGSTDTAVLAEARSTLSMTDSVVQETSTAASTNGFGISILESSSVTLKGSALVANHSAGIAVLEKGANVTIEDSLIAGTLPDADGTRGYGVTLELGARADLRGSALVANTTSGIGALDPGTKVTLTGSVIADTRSDGAMRAGKGVTLGPGAAITITTSAIVGNRDVGIAVQGVGGSATIDQTVVRGTLPLASNGSHGRGIEIGSGATAKISRTSVLQNRAVGILAISDDSTVDVQNTWIADTAAEGAAGGAGRAATAQSATMTMLGVVAQRSRQLAVVVAGEGASLSVKSSRFEDVAAGDDGNFGHGLVAALGATMLVDDVTVRRCASSGLVWDGATGTVRASRVTDNAIGIAAQGGSVLQQVEVVPDPPIPGVVAVTADTAFVDNVTRIGAGVVPVPAPL